MLHLCQINNMLKNSCLTGYKNANYIQENVHINSKVLK